MFELDKFECYLTIYPYRGQCAVNAYYCIIFKSNVCMSMVFHSKLICQSVPNVIRIIYNTSFFFINSFIHIQMYNIKHTLNKGYFISNKKHNRSLILNKYWAVPIVCKTYNSNKLCNIIYEHNVERT